MNRHDGSSNRRDEAIQSSTCRVILTTVSAASMIVAGLGLAARYLPITNHITLLGAGLAPYLMLGGPIAAVLLLAARRWVLASVAGCLTIALVVTQLPLYLAPGSSASAAGTVRIMTANLKFGRADAHALTSQAISRADVLAVQELTPDVSRRLSEAGLDASFPYYVRDARDNASGVGLYSRYPISLADSIAGYEMAFITAVIRVPGVALGVSVIVAHMSGPWPQPINDWREDVNRLPTTMGDLADASGAGAVIFAGDFNSTYDMRPFRELLRNGYRDAAEQAGAGMTPTYPGDAWIPPFVGIDHVLTRNCTAIAVETAGLPGSDHRALVATVRLP